MGDAERVKETEKMRAKRGFVIYSVSLPTHINKDCNMFSGIVEETATVVALVKEQENLHLTMKCSFVDELKIDQSVAHNGVCLTVVKIENGNNKKRLSD